MRDEPSDYKIKWALCNAILNILRAEKGEPLVECKYPGYETYVWRCYNDNL